MHAVWPRTPATRLRLPAADLPGHQPHLAAVLGACAGLAGEPSIDVVYVTLPGGDDLFRLASRTGARLGPAACVDALRVRSATTASPEDAADLGVVSLGAGLRPAELRAAVRLAHQLACRRVLFVLPAGRASADTARALGEVSRVLSPFARVDSGTFGPWSRQPDFVALQFDPSPEDGVAMAA